MNAVAFSMMPMAGIGNTQQVLALLLVLLL